MDAGFETRPNAHLFELFYLGVLHRAFLAQPRQLASVIIGENSCKHFAVIVLECKQLGAQGLVPARNGVGQRV